ncbi:MAG: FxsA family protein [Solirubrobacterales bacterium]|jgi:UPF0716 protein FxsA|nr:FxsA family protein [Solirubrobacterales bacterium]
MRRLNAVILLLLLIGVPAVEVLAFIEVGLAIGWSLATALLVATSLLGVLLLRIQGRSALRRVSLAVSEHREPGRAALDGALGFLGCILLVAPGFVSDTVGALLLLPPTRAVVRRWVSRHYAARVMRLAGTAARFGSRGRDVWPADVDSTAVEDDRDQLGA